jgi:FMN phosphatase YigB (HAD superfamily)
MVSSSKYLLWDFDGTLAYRPGQWTDTVIAILHRAGLAPGIDPETVRPFMNAGFPWHEPDTVRESGRPADEWWQALEPVLARAFKHAGKVGDERAMELAREVRHTYLDASAWIVFDDVVPVLTRLAALRWQHIVLSNHVPEVPQLVEQLGLARHFEAVHTSGHTGVEKPNPEAFRRVVATLPVGAAMWMIGNSPSADVQGAEAAGIPAILVRHDAPLAGHRCANLTELIEIVEGPSLGEAS